MKGTERLYIIRWSELIPFPDGKVTAMAVKHGSREEVEAYARRIAEENDVSVEVVD